MSMTVKQLADSEGDGLTVNDAVGIQKKLTGMAE